jgi:hypothetical protein
VEPSRRQGRIAIDLAVIAAASIIAYAASLRGYFLSDDFHVVTLLNPARTAVDWSNVLSDFLGVYRGDPTHSYYRPLITLSAAIDYSLWGLNPFGGHLTNLFLNLANGFLVYGIASLLSPSPTRGFGLLAGLLFSLHPLHPEAVYWLVGRTELIVASLVLLSIMAYLVYVTRRRPLWLLLSISAFLLALASKETAVSVPFALTLHRVLFPDAGPDGSSPPTPLLLAPHYLLLGVYLLFRKAVTGHVIGQYGAMGTELFAPSLMPKGVVHLVAYQLYPIGGALPTPAGDALMGEIARRLISPLAWALALAIVGLVIAARIDRRAWFCLGLMLIFAIPLLSLFAERGSPDDAPRIYYLPSAGFSLFIAALLVRTRAPLRRVLTPVILFSFAALLAANSLPWIRAGQITEEIVRRIEGAANVRGVQELVLTGHPDFYFGAELFGTKGWALQVAAAPPFANIPNGIRVITALEEPCAQLAAGRLKGGGATTVLNWDAKRATLDELPFARLRDICRTVARSTP